MDKREAGTVKKYDKVKGYGLIEPDYGKDIFVHDKQYSDRFLQMNFSLDSRQFLISLCITD